MVGDMDFKAIDRLMTDGLALTEWSRPYSLRHSCTIHVQTNYSYSFWRNYSSEYEYSIRTTIRHRSEYEANIRYTPTLNTRELCFCRWI